MSQDHQSVKIKAEILDEDSIVDADGPISSQSDAVNDELQNVMKKEDESEPMVVDVSIQSDSEPSTQTPTPPISSKSLQATDQNINNSFDSTNYSTIQGFTKEAVSSEIEMLRDLLRESEEKLRLAQIDFSRRENILLFRLKAKDQEMQEYINQLNELKASIAPSTGKLRDTLLDPAVNLLIKNLKKELDESKRKLEDTQNDLNAWKFTPDSNTGKRLMAKCRMLYQENEELGKVITSGRTAKLESDLALQKSLTEEMKQSQSELDELVQELDEDVDGMQSTIYFLQTQLQEFQQQQSKD